MQSDFKSSYWTKELKSRINYVKDNIGTEDEAKIKKIDRYLNVVKRELIEDAGTEVVNDINLRKALERSAFTPEVADDLNAYLDALFTKYLNEYNLAVQKKEKLIYALENNFKYDLSTMKDKHYNESLSDLVRNLNVKERVIEFEGELLQIVDPIFNDPKNPENLLDYRTHFFAPKKHLFGVYFDTYWFNLVVIWLMAVVLYIALYFELLKKAIASFESLAGKLKDKESN